MRIRLITKTRYLFLILVLSVTASVRISAQAVRFVQITDPHLFDGGEEGVQNKAALAASIAKLNERMNEDADFLFAVMTGDIGIENLVSTGKRPNGDSILEPNQVKRDQRIEQGAAELASILSQSKIRVWLFLPGNNDLLNEEPDTQYYRVFVKKLQALLPNLEITDLCPEEPNVDKQQLGVYRVGSAAFIGFNNASFKNNNDPARVTQYKDKQLEYVRQVVSRTAANDIRRAYVFYHIPELDDPYIVMDSGAKRPTSVGNPYPSSSWFVDKDVHEAWKKLVVDNEKVRGLFAGHYHDWRRDTYLGYHWLQTTEYPSGSLSKLYIAPPLAIKRQPKQSQARGFQEITIDGTGTIGREIWWLNSTDLSFDTEPSSKNNELNLALFYEGAHEWQQAETHFTEAAKTAPSTAVRNAALAGLTRVKSAQYPWVKEAWAWSDPLFLGRLFGFVVVALFLWLAYIGLREGSQAMVIHPFEGDDQIAKLLAAGFPATRAKIVGILGTTDQSIIKPVIGAYPFVFPKLDEIFPQESFELAGIAVPNLNILLTWLIRPRFQVTGGISDLLFKKYIYAVVWRRRWWFGTRLLFLVDREIPDGYKSRIEIENFIFEVYLKANATL